MSRIKAVSPILHLPSIGPEERISLTKMSMLINSLPIEWKRSKLTDHWFYAPSWEGCNQIIEYLKVSLPRYYANKFDCENFAGWFRHKAAETFGINIFAEVEGLADVKGYGVRERHGWIVFTDGKDFWQLETQTGVIMDIDDPLYVPDEITMG